MDQIQNRPYSSLPWEFDGRFREITMDEGRSHVADFDSIADKDAKYIIHACNAYPKLIDFVKSVNWKTLELDYEQDHGAMRHLIAYAFRLLEELGEHPCQNRDK